MTNKYKLEIVVEYSDVGPRSPAEVIGDLERNLDCAIQDGLLSYDFEVEQCSSQVTQVQDCGVA